MVSATVAMPSATLRVGNSEVHQGRMDSITVPLAVNQKAPVELAYFPEALKAII